MLRFATRFLAFKIEKYKFQIDSVLLDGISFAPSQCACKFIFVD